MGIIYLSGERLCCSCLAREVSINFPTKTVVCIVAFLLLATGALAQMGRSSSTSSGSGSAGRNIGRDTSPLNPENSLEIIRPPVPGEEKAYKAFQKFQALSNEELAKNKYKLAKIS